MGNPLRHLPRRDAGRLIYDLADAIYRDTHWSASEALRALCDHALGHMGLPQRADTRRFPQVSAWLEMYAEALRFHEPFEDLLGQLYMALASRGHRTHLGQHFTPMAMARLQAQLLGTFRATAGAPLCSIHDPACGSGAMLLACLQIQLERAGPEGLRGLSISGVDLDGLCARMAALQLLANVNLHRFELGHVAIVHGNSLTLETHELVVCASRRDLPAEQLRGYLGFR